MLRIINWTARRSGGAITVTGQLEGSGEDFKIPNVDSIVSAKEGHAVAKDKDDAVYLLLNA